MPVLGTFNPPLSNYHPDPLLNGKVSHVTGCNDCKFTNCGIILLPVTPLLIIHADILLLLDDPVIPLGPVAPVFP